jgi:hypothetical protein
MRTLIAVVLAAFLLSVLHRALVELLSGAIDRALVSTATSIALALVTGAVGWVVHKLDPAASWRAKLEGTAWLTAVVAGMAIAGVEMGPP